MLETSRLLPHKLPLKPVRQQLAHILRSAMLKCFPLAFTTDLNDQKLPKFEELVHLSSANGFGNKAQDCDYFSCTP